MRPHVPALLAVCLLMAAGATAQVPLYTNVEIVSVDARNRSLMVRTNEGQARILRVEDAVNVDGLRRGDRVIVALRHAPDGDRVSRMLRGGEPPAPAPTAAVGLPRRTSATRVPGTTQAQGTTSATSIQSPPPDPRPSVALDEYANRVALLAREAVSVDAAWSMFASACDVSVTTPHDRGWFAVWENSAVRADLSTGTCRELYNRVIERGEQVKTAMSAAEERARQAALLPGALRDVRSRYALDWDGWDRPAPPPLTP